VKIYMLGRKRKEVCSRERKKDEGDKSAEGG
jgi:hypothetical protein